MFDRISMLRLKVSLFAIFFSYFLLSCGGSSSKATIVANSDKKSLKSYIIIHNYHNYYEKYPVYLDVYTDDNLKGTLNPNSIYTFEVPNGTHHVLVRKKDGSKCYDNSKDFKSTCIKIYCPQESIALEPASISC